VNLTIVCSVFLHLLASSGPEFCESDLREENLCKSTSSSSSDVDRSCGVDEVCTSSCQCWDGTSVRGDDVMKFTGMGIDEQGGCGMH
jgi:hypothetical protein